MMKKAEKPPEKILPYSWMVRPCLIYQEEYNDCTSIKGRFHQYFIHGDTIDCSQWRRDADNCLRWDESKNLNSVKSLIESEKQRRTDRLQTYIQNNVWEIRDGPPEDWYKPLPDWMKNEYSTTYLALKSEERKSKTLHEESGRICVIS